MTEYGLGGLRDTDGNRKPVEHTYEFNGSELTIKFVPPTISEIDEIEDVMLQDDLTPADIQQPLNDYLVEPSIPEQEDWTMREFNCYIQGIYRWSIGDEGVGADITDELDERTDGEGN